MNFTKQQEVTLRKKGGASVLKKMRLLEKKIDTGKASDKDQTQFDQLMDRSLNLIGANLNGTIEEDPKPKDKPIVNAEDEKIQARDYYDKRLANLKKFKIEEREVFMFSHRLKRNIWVVTTEGQRIEKEKGTDEVWTIDEAIILATKERALAIEGEDFTDEQYASISTAKQLFDGEVVQ